MLLSATTALVKAAARQAAAVPVLGPAVLDNRREPLQGRVLFITGAARGLGAELARQAHTEGAQVALVGRRLEPLQALAAELGDDRAATFEADVTDLDALQRAADDCARTRLTLVLNACHRHSSPA